MISNGLLSQQKEKLRKTGFLDFFDIVTTASEYDYTKQNPKLYEAIMIGDQIEKDILPCLSIGMDAIWLN